MSTEKTWLATSTTHLYRHKTGTYYARLTVAGKPTWRSLKTKTLSVAKPELAKLLEDNAHRDELSRDTKVTEKMTGEEALTLHETQLLNDPATKKGTKRYWKEIVAKLKKTWPALPSLELRGITVEQCEAWAGKASKLMSSTRFNNTLLVLKSLFKIAIKHGVRRTNPAEALKRAKNRRKDLSNKLPSQSRFREWVAALRERKGRKAQHKADMVELLAYTGMRLGESKWVQWKHCEFDKGEILVLGAPDDGTKNGSFRRIPMIPAARRLLERLKGEQQPALSDYVIQTKTANKSMKKAAETIEMDALTHHDLRHLFATTCIESGVDIPTVSRWLGHQDGGVLALKVYGHLRNEHSLAAANRVSFSA
ncbi:MAG TPA: site-specific integrase [Prosthecobacter sp.]